MLGNVLLIIGGFLLGYAVAAHRYQKREEREDCSELRALVDKLVAEYDALRKDSGD